MICKKCNKIIPKEKKFFEEYLILNKNLNNSFETKNTKEIILYKRIFKNFEFKHGIELCKCKISEEQEEEFLKNYNMNTLTENNYKNFLILNKNFNIVRNRTIGNKIIEFLKEEKIFHLMKKIDSFMIEYDEFKILLNNIYKNNFLTQLSEIKNNKILIIYNCNLISETSKEDNIDNKIINIIKYRIANNLTTYFIYNGLRKNSMFSTILNNIKEANIKKFYSAFKETFDISIENNIFNVININTKININNDKKETKKEETKKKTIRKIEDYQKKVEESGLINKDGEIEV